MDHLYDQLDALLYRAANTPGRHEAVALYHRAQQLQNRINRQEAAWTQQLKEQADV